MKRISEAFPGYWDKPWRDFVHTAPHGVNSFIIIILQKMLKYKYMAAIVALLVTGCAQYSPQPIDLSADMANWHQVSVQMCGSRRSISTQELRRIGLMMNPELLKARLTHARSKGRAEYAGLWEDPGMGMELERVFANNITNYSISPSLALPVTGLPGLRKQIAEQYSEADYWNVREQERQFMMELDVLCYKCQAADARLSLMRRRLNVLRDEQSRITRLHEVGEVAFADFQTATERLNETIKQVQEQEREQLTLRQELVSRLGLHPSITGIHPSGGLPRGVPSAVAVPGADMLLGIASVKAQMAGYGASEDELRAEIRKQFPELRLSGMFAVDDDTEKGSLGVEFTLPLWNRNREAIAVAGAERDIKQAETLQTWHALLQESTALGAQQRLLQNHCRSEYSRLRELETATARQERLFSLGESKLLELAEARHLEYERRLAYLDCLVNLLEVQTKLLYLNPSHNQQ